MSSALTFPFDAPPPPGATREVAPGVHWLRMPLPFALDHINLWLVEGAPGWTLIDTGLGDPATRALWERHFERALAGRPLERIVVTHYHPDHAGNAAWLASRCGVDVHMTMAEFLTGHAIHAQSSGYALADTVALFRSHGVDDEHLAALGARGNAYRRGVPELPRRFARIYAGERLRVGALEARVIAGYGHSPEHAALHAAAHDVLVSGDMLLPRISTNVSVWPAEALADPLARFLGSLDAFAALPERTLVLPSHGLPFRGIAARVAALHEHHAARLAELEEAIAGAGAPVSAADVVPLLFRRELDMQQRFFAIGEAIAHLNHLAAAGRVMRAMAPDGTVRFATN
ncbi:MAG: MBL fold metallo-hydrolase [Betaproteobacteria bacterium]|nr:MBL fold metallo-hydrolase [Betaproteobacteria bacterium]